LYEKKFTRNKVFLYFLVLSIKGNLFIFPSCLVPLINNDTAQINPESTNQRISGAFEVGRGIMPGGCGASSSRFTSIGAVGSFQIGYGISKNFEAGGQFGGGIGQFIEFIEESKEESNSETISESKKEKERSITKEKRSIIGNLTGLGYLKIGGSGGNFNFAIKLAPGVGIFYSTQSIIPFILPIGYVDLMLGFGNPEKLTLYLGLEYLIIPRLGANLHFEKFSLFAQISGAQDLFFLKLGAGYKF
jgi:hypothetical protein